MDEDLITTISREYAEEVYKNSHKETEVLPNCLSNEAINMIAEDIENKLKWLSRRFCLVEKSKVEDAYKSAIKEIRDGYKSRTGGTIAMGGAKGALLESLFPEIVKKVKGVVFKSSNVEKLGKNDRCEKCGAPNSSICAHMNCQEYISPSEPKPAEPKLDRGQKCKIIGGKGTKGLIGQIVTLTSFVPEENAWAAMLSDMSFIYLTESDLEPYTDPEEESRNLYQSMSNCDKDNAILKNSFSNHNRLHIAAMAMQGLLGNMELMIDKTGVNVNRIAKFALECADALITELEKGGNHE